MGRDAGSRHGWSLSGKRKAGEAHGGGPKKGWARLDVLKQYEMSAEEGRERWRSARLHAHLPFYKDRGRSRDIPHPLIEAVLYRERLWWGMFQHAAREVRRFEPELPCDGSGRVIKKLRRQREHHLRGNVEPSTGDQRHGALVVDLSRIVVCRKVPLRLGSHQERSGEMEQHGKRNPLQDPLKEERASLSPASPKPGKRGNCPLSTLKRLRHVSLRVLP